MERSVHYYNDTNRICIWAAVEARCSGKQRFVGLRKGSKCDGQDFLKEWFTPWALCDGKTNGHIQKVFIQLWLRTDVISLLRPRWAFRIPLPTLWHPLQRKNRAPTDRRRTLLIRLFRTVRYVTTLLLPGAFRFRLGTENTPRIIQFPTDDRRPTTDDRRQKQVPADH